MPRRLKEEERIEMIIRGLLRQPENKRCINCNSSGPQYVCTTFWTFVCTSCSGVHREFTHRVKSVSMAKFNEEEITALQAGGNGRAREIYFKAWDPQRNNLPDNRLREFVKHVYVDRKYAGENSNKLPMVKLVSLLLMNI
ncbi:UNVERIFIED_CONTAM: putative ADP-ribosylation factor GTPase-activating protein AGD14 [Sesamum radiatum]|uniref:ADP-ribosylation factor GTPase-activating protein AGD14 n=1 Tax=Sesamum radiatum TaxID=300843 RepID=A0AAW2KZS5_SESRA